MVTKKRQDFAASIVLITLDTLRQDRLGCYGYFRDTSPTLDAFADEAVLFEQAFSPTATTLPSHVSLFTATNPSRHSVLGNVGTFRRRADVEGSLRTLPQMLKEAGYLTAGFVSARPVAEYSGIAAGIDGAGGEG